MLFFLSILIEFRLFEGEPLRDVWKTIDGIENEINVDFFSVGQYDDFCGEYIQIIAVRYSYECH